MADATAPLIQEEVIEKYAPEREALAMEFEPRRKYVFVLAEENPIRELPVIDMRAHRAIPHQKFKPYQNLVLSSQIVWKGQRRNIRYYDGCTTIFVDEQPQDKELIDQLIKQTKKRHFGEGKFYCYGEERMLLLFMYICSWNIESPFRTQTAYAVFRPLDSKKKATAEAQKLDETEKALELAKKANLTKMKIHATYLGISLTDWDTDAELTEDELRAEYRAEALRNSKNFITSYGDKTIEIKYYINQALQQGLINNKVNPNIAVWGKGNTTICDISGLKTQEAISQRLLEFSETKDGKEFGIQLRALFEK